MSLDPKKFQIRIQSILGGHSSMSHFSTADQFLDSVAIDPSYSMAESGSGPIDGIFRSSGLLRPVPMKYISSSTGAAPMWIRGQPKSQLFYVYNFNGSVYSCDPNSNFIPLSDGGTMTGGTGNGAEYYDNYMYFSKGTTVARYGPLNGAAIFDGDYWGTTLSKPAMTDTSYPISTIGAYTNNLRMPNHVMCRHSDGKLYFGDVQNNQGVLHYISTTKSTVEGDTDNGSTFQKLTFGYGLWPTAIETYGSSLAIALVEHTTNTINTNSRNPVAKLAFWDTTSQNFNSIIWIEFPDQMITALKNVNGVLYIISAHTLSDGVRVSRYIGGSSIEEVAYFQYGIFPYAGAVDGNSERLVFGSSTSINGTTKWPCVYSLGLQKADITKGLYCPLASINTSNGSATAVYLAYTAAFNDYSPIFGTNNNTLESARGSDYSLVPSMWRSQVFKIGQPFKITKLRLPFAQAIAANMTVTAKIYTDDGLTSYTLQTINNTNYPNFRNVVLRSGANGEVLSGNNNFFLELKWTGSALATVGLPITIEYELTPDD